MVEFKNMSSDTNPLVSLVIPVYNAELYIRQCIDSIKTQSYHNIEVLIVDDGSTDKSIQICKELVNGDSRFKIITHSNNKGLPAARNTGVKNAQGRYIWHIDADDFIVTWAVEKLVERAEADQSDIVWGAARMWPSGILLKQRPRELKKPFRYEEEHALWTGGGVVTFLFRASFIRRSGVKFKESIQIGEDKIYLSKILPRASSISYVYQTCYFYRIGVGMMSEWTERKISDVASYIGEVSSSLKQHGESIFNYNMLATFAYRADLFIIAKDIITESNQKAFFDKISDAYRGVRIELASRPRAQPWRPVVNLPSQLHRLLALFAEGNTEAALQELSELREHYLHPKISGITPIVNMDAKYCREIAPMVADILSREQRHARLLHFFARVNMRIGNSGSAEAAERKALRLDPKLASSCVNLSQICAVTGRTSEASMLAQRGVNLDPDCCAYLDNLGHCALLQGDWDLATKCCQEEFIIDDAYASAFILRSRIEQTKDFEGALKTAGRAVALAPDSGHVLLSYISLLVQNKLLAEAADIARKWSSADPGHLDAKLILGDLLVKLGENIEASQVYQEILDFYPSDIRCLRNLSIVLRKTNRPAESVEVAKRAIDADPYDAKSYAALGRALAKSRNHRASQRAFSKAIELDPSLEPTIRGLSLSRRLFVMFKAGFKKRVNKFLP